MGLFDGAVVHATIDGICRIVVYSSGFIAIVSLK